MKFKTLLLINCLASVALVVFGERNLAGTFEPQAIIDDRPLQPLTLNQIIHQEAKANGVRPQLVKAIISIESSWRPEVVSHKGAVGLMQVMPDTARRVCDIHDPKLLKNPNIGVMCGSAVIGDHIERRGNEYDALREYYCGHRLAFEKKLKTCHNYAARVLKKMREFA